jgi:hypothetical protein
MKTIIITALLLSVSAFASHKAEASCLTPQELEARYEAKANAAADQLIQLGARPNGYSQQTEAKIWDAKLAILQHQVSDYTNLASAYGSMANIGCFEQ